MKFMQVLRLIMLGVMTIGSHLNALSAENMAVQRLTPLLNKTQTMRANFSQVTLDASGTRLQEVKGEVWVKRPGLLRWQAQPPFEQLLVSNGQKVWLYDPDLSQVTVQDLDKRLTRTPVLLLSGDVSKIKEHFVVTYREGGNVLDFMLKPKESDSLFESLRLSFKMGTLNDMQIIDASGQKTNILFLNVKANQSISNDKFEFVPPSGTDIINQ